MVVDNCHLPPLPAGTVNLLVFVLVLWIASVSKYSESKVIIVAVALDKV